MADESGELVIVFTGRRSVGGIVLGTYLAVEGTVANRNGHRTILNPAIELLKVPEAPHAPTH